MRTTIKTILCAVDFSKYSRQVVQYAAGLAAHHKARLLVFHAVSFPRSPIHGTVITGAAPTRRAAAEQANRRIKELMAECTVNWQIELRHGDPVEEILTLCDRQPVDLVIAASHGLTGLRRVLLGSIVEQMAHTLKHPLLILRSKTMYGRNKSALNPNAGQILVGCRLDPDLPTVISSALAMAPLFNPRYHFVHVLEAPIDEQIVDPSGGPYGQVQEKLQTKVLQKVEAALAPFNLPPEKYVVRIVDGHPGEQLAAYAEHTGIDLVAIGVRARTTLARRLSGSTAETLLRQAPCPVLTVPTAITAQSSGRP